MQQYKTFNSPKRSVYAGIGLHEDYFSLQIFPMQRNGTEQSKFFQ